MWPFEEKAHYKSRSIFNVLNWDYYNYKNCCIASYISLYIILLILTSSNKAVIYIYNVGSAGKLQNLLKEYSAVKRGDSNSILL